MTQGVADEANACADNGQSQAESCAIDFFNLINIKLFHLNLHFHDDT